MDSVFLLYFLVGGNFFPVGRHPHHLEQFRHGYLPILLNRIIKQFRKLRFECKKLCMGQQIAKRKDNRKIVPFAINVFLSILGIVSFCVAEGLEYRALRIGE